MYQKYINTCNYFCLKIGKNTVGELYFLTCEDLAKQKKGPKLTDIFLDYIP